MNKGSKLLTGYILILVMTLIAVQLGNRAMTAMAENAPPERNRTIVIDPGHGGVDGGATSCTGILESRFNLEIALRLEDLCHLLGLQTRMIRREDISVYTAGDTIAQKKASDLKERVRITEDTPGAILVSIHQNQYPDSRYSGAQVFYAKTEGSETLAKELQSVFLSALNPGSRRQAKKSQGIYLMDRIGCPGVLIECGFLSNPEEEGKLRSETYQKQLCCVIAPVLQQYVSNT